MEYLATDADDGRRADRGVVVCIRELDNGQSRLIFDDVSQNGAVKERFWRHEAFYTWNAYNNHSLDDMALSDEDFRQIGIMLVARLLALDGRVK